MLVTTFIYQNLQSASTRNGVILCPNNHALICGIVNNLMHSVGFEAADEQISAIGVMATVSFQDGITPICVDHKIVTAQIYASSGNPAKLRMLAQRRS